MTDPLQMHVEPSLRDPALVLAFAGWNDAGEAATTALGYLDAALRSVPLAELDPDDFYDFTVRRPDVVHAEGSERVVVWPATQFRFGPIDSDREVVTGLGVEPHMRWRRYCDAILDLTGRVGAAHVVLLGAYQAEVVYSQPVQVTGFASDAAVLEALSVTNSEYQGPTGIVGVLGTRLQEAGVPFVSLWVGLPHYINASPNPRGALALVQKLCIHLGVKLDEEPLRTQAADFEEKISKLVASDAELSEYVRQLKKREFAQ